MLTSSTSQQGESLLNKTFTTLKCFILRILFFWNSKFFNWIEVLDKTCFTN